MKRNGYKEYQIEIGRRIKAYRVNANIKQKDLENKSGVSMRSISRLENGEPVELESLLKILIALDLDSNIDLLIPDQTIRPSYYLKDESKHKQRVRNSKSFNNDFVWEEDK